MGRPRSLTGGDQVEVQPYRDGVVRRRRNRPGGRPGPQIGPPVAGFLLTRLLRLSLDSGAQALQLGFRGAVEELERQ